MGPDLLLGVDDKKMRFKKFKVSKKAPEESNSESEEREIQVVQDIQRKGKKTIDNIKSKPRKLKSPDKTLSNSLSTIPTSPLSSVWPMLPWLQDA